MRTGLSLAQQAPPPQTGVGSPLWMFLDSSSHRRHAVGSADSLGGKHPPTQDSISGCGQEIPFSASDKARELEAGLQSTSSSPGLPEPLCSDCGIEIMGVKARSTTSAAREPIFLASASCTHHIHSCRSSGARRSAGTHTEHRMVHKSQPASQPQRWIHFNPRSARPPESKLGSVASFRSLFFLQASFPRQGSHCLS